MKTIDKNKWGHIRSHVRYQVRIPIKNQVGIRVRDQVGDQVCHETVIGIAILIDFLPNTIKRQVNDR